MTKSWLALVLLVSLPMLPGCPASDSVVYRDVPEGSLRIALYQWREHGFTLLCSPNVLELATANSDAIHSACRIETPGQELLGCLMGNTIVMLDTAYNGRYRELVFQHEVRHWLAGCSNPPGTPDGNHEIEAVWFLYYGVDVRYPSTWRQ
jgi:hypothetical protein